MIRVTSPLAAATGQASTSSHLSPRKTSPKSAPCLNAIATTPVARAPPGSLSTGPKRRPSSSRSSRTNTSACLVSSASIRFIVHQLMQCLRLRPQQPRCSMGKVTGFLEIEREQAARRSVEERVQDWFEIYQPFPEEKQRDQSARCMDCGVPFCHTGYPVNNLIPDWNDLPYNGPWQTAIRRLHATNNFPEFTGRICPAPCEASCVLAINQPPVTIKQIEKTIVERGFKEGWIRPEPPQVPTRKKIAVGGSGPAGLATAQQLCRAGHWVSVYEKADRMGGLLRYGIPQFKLEKQIIDRRLEQMSAEGVQF